MQSPTISRRALLLAGAGAFAGALARPARTLAQAGRPPLSALALGNVPSTGRVLELPPGVGLVGLQWRGAPRAAPRIRVRLPDGRWGPWVAAGSHGHRPEAPERGDGASVGEPLWTGGARVLQLDPGGAGLRDALLHLVASELPGPDRAAQASLPLAEPVLQTAAQGQPPIIARRAWALDRSPPRVAPEYGEVRLSFVHHTDNPNGYSAAEVPAMLRAIYVFHRYVNGWNDIGYNFVVDLFGRIFEARAGGIDEPVVGAQAGGYNLVSTGVAVLGSFSEAPISTAARESLQRLLAWKLSLHGVAAVGRVTVRVERAGAVYSRFPVGARVSLPRIAGHRDADSTDCPGNDLYGQLPAIRRVVRAAQADAVSVTLTLLPAPASGGEAAEPSPPSLQASVQTLDGTPLPAAPVLLQARAVSRRGETVTETTLAEGVTDASGLCAFSTAFAAGAPAPLWVRALHPSGPGAGAGVSTALRVAPQAAPLSSGEASAPSA